MQWLLRGDRVQRGHAAGVHFIFWLATAVAFVCQSLLHRDPDSAHSFAVIKLDITVRYLSDRDVHIVARAAQLQFRCARSSNLSIRDNLRPIIRLFQYFLIALIVLSKPALLPTIFLTSRDSRIIMLKHHVTVETSCKVFNSQSKSGLKQKHTNYSRLQTRIS